MEDGASVWLAARRGDREAIGRLCERLAEVARSVFRTRRVRTQEVEGLVHDAVASLLRLLPHAGDELENVDGFLFWRAVGAYRDHLRRDVPTVPLLDTDVAARASDVDDAALRAAIDACIAALGEPDRTVFRLRYVDGIRGDALAARFGRNRTWVSRRLSDAREALARCLREKGYGPCHDH